MNALRGIVDESLDPHVNPHASGDSRMAVVTLDGDYQDLFIVMCWYKRREDGSVLRDE